MNSQNQYYPQYSQNQEFTQYLQNQEFTHLYPIKSQKDNVRMDRNIRVFKWASKNDISPRFLYSGFYKNGRYICTKKIEGASLKESIKFILLYTTEKNKHIIYREFIMFHIPRLITFFKKVLRDINYMDSNLNKIIYEPFEDKYYIIDFKDCSFRKDCSQMVESIIKKLLVQITILFKTSSEELKIILSELNFTY